MGTTREVEDKLPGLRFYGVDATITGTGTKERWIGTVTMKCEVTDKALWQIAVDKLECLKVFSSTADELLDALGYELNNTAVRLEEAESIIAEKDAEIARLQGILNQIGVDLGIETPMS